jgi:parallel beta-helix repeat protein
VASYYAPVRPVEQGQTLELTRGMVFLDGVMLRQITDVAAFERTSGVFMVPADGKSLLVRLPFDREPHGLTFEITTREQVFAPRELRKNFIHLEGLTFEHGANGLGVPQFGMVSSSKGKYWILEDCKFRWACTAGLDVGEMAWYPPPGRKDNPSPSTGKLDFNKTIRRCTFSNNGVAGMWSYGGGPMLVEDCIVERNRWQPSEHAEDGGIKCHGIGRSVFRNNLFRDNDSFGLWLDVVSANNRITGNLFIGNRNAGVFVERTAPTTLVDNNISLFTRSWTYRQLTMADGFYNHQSSNVIFAHNLSMSNAGFGFRNVLWGANDGSNSFNPYTCKVSHNRVVNNIAYANSRGAIGLPVDQKFCFSNSSDHNFIWGAASAPLFELERGVSDAVGLAGQIENVIAVHNIAPQEALMLHRWKSGQLGPEVGDMRHGGPRVGLPVWQKLRGFDTHSVVGALPVCLAYRDGRLYLHVKRPDKLYSSSTQYSESGQVIGARPDSYGLLSDVECPRLPYITYDYFGKPRPPDRPTTVGPIQDLDKIAGGDKPIELLLWPNASPDRPPATEVQIDIEPESIVGDWEKEK